MIKICVVTTNRADFGLLRPVIKKLSAREAFDVRVVASGSHLSPEFGMTIDEIDESEIVVDKKIEILLSGDTPSAISKSMGVALMGFADYFNELKPDFLLVLGDRFEMLAICSAAANARIPIIHLYGGETTEGAVDECVRHSITKMSLFHFTATEVFRKRVIQMGEDPQRVFCVGAMGVENALHTKLLSEDEIRKALGVGQGRKYAVCTFHPVTLEDNTSEGQIKELLNAAVGFPDVDFVWTSSNADSSGRKINQTIKEYGENHSNIKIVSSLGTQKYLSAVAYSCFVLGNSSSGLAEVPSFGVPTINVGDRQKGRILATSVISCAPKASDVENAIKKALGDDFLEKARSTDNPYGDGKTSDKIVSILEEKLVNGEYNIKKKFYDIEFDV